MQDLAIDKLASKRIPAANRINSLPHLVGDYARSASTDRAQPAVTADHSVAKAAMPKSASSHVVSPAGVRLERVYSGTMTMSGGLTATSNQTGTWSGTLNDTLFVSVDAAGNGTGYEVFTGNVTLTVKNPDGSQKSVTNPFNFASPTLTLVGGKFSVSEDSGFNASGLLFTLNMSGSFSGSPQNISEKLSLPFTGEANGAIVSGTLRGTSTVKTDPLVIGGSATSQTGYSASNVKIFKNTIVSDLSGGSVTATVKLSRAANGTLTNLAGGTYDKAKGLYTITGSGSAVASAIKNLTFVSVGNLASSGKAVTTSFTLNVSDTAGGAQSVQTSVTTSEPLSLNGLLPHQSTKGTTAISPFHGVTIGEVRGGRLSAVTVALSDPSNGTLENLSGGVYDAKTGVYVIYGSAGAVNRALNKLEFVPAKAGGTATKLTITAENSTGAVISRAVTVVSRGAAVSEHMTTGVWMFSQYIAMGLPTVVPQASAQLSHHDLSAHPLSELAGSHR